MHLDDADLRQILSPAPVAWEELEEHRLAAVLAAIVRGPDGDQLLFTQRHADLPEHAGQVAFPGGAREGNESPIECALREAHEEVGLHPRAVTILGAIPNRTSSSVYRVHTVVGRIEPTQLDALRMDPREVDAIFTVSLAELARAERWEDREVAFRGTEIRKSPHFVHGAHTIWGLTGRLTLDLLDRL